MDFLTGAASWKRGNVDIDPCEGIKEFYHYIVAGELINPRIPYGWNLIIYSKKIFRNMFEKFGTRYVIER